MNYYNEWDKSTAAWLRELIKAGVVPPGDVDERSITEVQPSDLDGYTQCHFFAGIGGWSFALQLAGWPADRPVWTGSCPCQPFSTAGKRKGQSDERHLWPEMFRLIRECRPYTVFGEQVEGAIRHGWLDGISADLEREVYAVGAVVFGTHSVGAPQIRQRLYWVANYRAQDAKQRYSTAQTALRRLNSGKHMGLEACAHLTGWATPTSRDHRDGKFCPNVEIKALLGRQVWPSDALTENLGALNPAFSRWLMGYPVAWCQAAISASRMLKQRQKRGQCD